MEKIVEVKSATYYYPNYNDEGIQIDSDNKRGITNIDLDIYKGEFLCIVGHNGSGKSTLAKLLNGLLRPKMGNVLVNGLDTKKKDNLFEIRKNLGMVFQNPDNQMITSIVEDDVAFGPENIGLPQEEIVKRVEWALSAVNMLEYRHKTPFKLSGGQKQRIAIAGVLAIKPNVLVLDESTAMLDPEGRREVMAILKELNKKDNMTIVLITHFMDEVIHADRVVVMNDGRMLTSGTPHELFTQLELLQSVGLDVPRVVKLADKLRKNGIDLPHDILTVEELEEKLWQLL